jgi:putative transposase
MTRPLRLEFSGALYHVTSRGDRKGEIYRDDVDRIAWLDTMRLVCARFNFVVHAYCQMTNHYHVLIETVEGNLSQGMRQLNGLYSQHFNRRHCLVGHVFQGRYNAILVQKEAYLLELTRYVVRNPLRARLVVSLDDWAWSSHCFMMMRQRAPEWLETDWLLGQFGERRGDAVLAYQRFVMAGEGLDSPLRKTSHQLLLGDESFVARHQAPANSALLDAVSKPHRRSLVWTIEDFQRKYPCRDEAMARAYFSTAFTMAQIGKHFGVSYKTVGRAVRRFEVGTNMSMLVLGAP